MVQRAVVVDSTQSTRGEWWVYGAEGIVIIGLLHTFFLAPPWLRGWLSGAAWPFVIYGIAVLGIAAASWAERSGSRVMVRPLRQSGFLLPLVPLLGAWAHLSPGHLTGSLAVGAFVYAALAVWRKSFWLTLGAAVFLNATYWNMLMESGAPIWRHPQLWLVPAALCWLASIQIWRAQIPGRWLAPLRYTGVLLLYLSSTADLLLNGIARSPGLALVLALLSLLGMALGILFKVRAFLFSGVAFLVVSLVSLVASAMTQLGWHWIWALAGMLLGIGIIAVLALLERKKAAIEAWLKNLQRWEG